MKKVSTINDLDQEMSGASTPVLVKFGATWCNPCKQQDLILEKIESNPDYNGSLKIVGVEIDNIDRAELNKFNVRSVPTLVLFAANGDKKESVFGLCQYDILCKIIDKYI